MLYLAIPAHNEVATIGVLLWRLRTVLAEFPREYEVVVYDDASTDDTAVVAEQYERAMPVTVLRGTTRLGYAGAVNVLLRHVATRTRYPRRDAVLLLQGDFTDPPVIVPEFARRFEGGADLVVGERLTVADAPTAVKRLFKYGHWAMRPFVKVDGVADLTASMRLVRISALREAIRVAGNAPLVSGDSWTANADLLLRLAPFARRVESVPMEPTFGVRMRETRRVAMADTLAVLKWAWGARGRKAVVGSSPAEAGPDERRAPRQRRRDEPELSVERLREKVRERDGTRGIDGAPPENRRGRRRERPDGAERAERPARSERTEREPRRTEAAATERAERTERTERVREPRETREPRPSREQSREKTRAPRPEREARTPETRGPEQRAAEPRTPETRAPRRREELRSPFADPTLELDDPFAPPSARRDARSLDAIMGGPANAPADEPVTKAAADATEAPEQTVGQRASDVRDRPAAPAEPAEPAKSADSADEDLGADVRGSMADSDLAGDDTDDSAGDESTNGGVDGDGETDGEPRRKRRRNRRSRRGRRRKAGAGDEESDSPEAASEASGESADDVAGEEGREDGRAEAGESSPESEIARPARDRGPRVRFTPADHIDGEPVVPSSRDDDDDEGEDDGDDDVAGVESMSEGAPRPRRRGRRGRRGGARRSRGRKERGDGAPPQTSADAD